MPPAIASVPSTDPHTAYLDYLRRTGRGNTAYSSAARTFFKRWPDPQQWAAEPLQVRLSAGSATRPIITFLMLHQGLRPGYDYLLERKLSSIWRDVQDSPLAADLDRFMTAAADLGFTERVRFATGSQVPVRLLIQTGRRLEQLTLTDLAEFTAACRDRQGRTGKGHCHYLAAASNAQRVLFHLGVLDELPRAGGPVPFAERLAQVRPTIRTAMLAYLERKRATCRPKTVSTIATRLKHFGVFLAAIDPDLDSVAALDRRKHIEPYLSSIVDAVNTKNGESITVADRSRRVLALMGFLTDITEWDWPETPPRKLLFRELLDLELDCVHEVPGHGSWLKVPLGKLDTERMIPLDEEILELIDHITHTRSHGRPLPHPRYRRPAQFLFTHHGRRLGQQAVRAELDRAAGLAGLEHITPHQLRHTYATALVNAGVSLQALMALLGHMSAEMSLRYGRLFDATVRSEYERALDLAKQQALRPHSGRTSLPLRDITGGKDWKDTPLLKSRMAGGFCLRAPAQGACAYANICEHCPSFHAEPSSLPILAAQRVDADALARDAEQRGWIAEADRHKQLITRLDKLINEPTTG
ncbi:tyrosine-type recombinase/integrase [Arthrobacter sp. MI7-26]|uniref:tyrosine-type recombinase/integrase n=1 Tax=Arthrobacter sp. MI7-26 TaxID=2993653 RepID=UPI00224901FE|nr:tyrosine-type recombinase/integrase [Arthrobacter sp. MI7-26]MCX2750449.1 tyrosine-type recombinase/integrase [Arthrobacter sp. MI7-26]